MGYYSKTSPKGPILFASDQRSLPTKTHFKLLIKFGSSSYDHNLLISANAVLIIPVEISICVTRYFGVKSFNM